MRLRIVPLLGHHALCGGLLEVPITTMVIAGGCLKLDNDELLLATFCLFDLVFSKLLEEGHDSGHSLCVRVRPFDGGMTFAIVRLFNTSPAGAFSA